MNKYKKEAIKFFKSLSREELIELLVEAGFEVEDGEGKIIFTNNSIKNDKETATNEICVNCIQKDTEDCFHCPVIYMYLQTEDEDYIY